MNELAVKKTFRNIFRLLLGVLGVFFVVIAADILPIKANTIHFIKTIVSPNDTALPLSTGLILES